MSIYMITRTLWPLTGMGLMQPLGREGLIWRGEQKLSHSWAHLRGRRGSEPLSSYIKALPDSPSLGSPAMSKTTAK